MTIKKTAALLLTLCLTAAALAIPAAAAETDKQDTEATVTFSTGLAPGDSGLTLKHAPSFDFGSHTISPNDEAYTATGSDMLLKLADARGTGMGWSVTARISEPFKTTGNQVLAGSRITISGGTVTYGADSVSPPPAPVSQTGIVLSNDGTAVPVLNAAEGAGKGIWNDSLDIVKLEVPGGAALADAYKATILWTLNDVPV